MTTHLFAPGSRARSITTVAVLAVAAVLISTPAPAGAASGRPAPVLAQGTGMGAEPSAQVRVVQRALLHRGYDVGPPGVDGRFGPLTAGAVRRMQADYGLAVDGVVGHHTRKALRLPRHRLVRTPSRSHGEHGPQATQEGKATSPQHAAVAPRTAPESNSVDLDSSSSDGFDPVVVGALAVLIGFGSLMAIGLAHRRRHRADPTESLTQPALVTTTAPPDADGPAPQERTMPPVDQGHTATPAPAGVKTAQRPPAHLPPGHAVIGYVTVPIDSGSIEDGDSAAAIEATCEHSGWELLEIVCDRENGRSLDRPGLDYALERIADGQADGLVVADLKRLSRSIVDLGALMAWFRDAHATLIALDLDIDTSTPEGHRVAATLITLHDWERERIASRTRNGLAEGRANGRATGRPAVSDRPELLERIAALRRANMTLQAIADQLNAEAIPTLRGGRKWRPSSIQAALGYRRPSPRDHLPSLTKRART
jgi:DNA invertase Pin-like site-specific DNA recombinase